jgi:hypothetical protein
LDRQVFNNAVDKANSYLENALKMKCPEKELALTVWDPRVRQLLGNLEVTRGLALKCAQPRLDRRRDSTELNQLVQDLLVANIGFERFKLEQSKHDEYYAEKCSELEAHRRKQTAIRDLFQIQDGDIKEIGKRVLKVSTDPS